MSRLTQYALAALDNASALIGRDNPEQLPQHILTGKAGEEAAYFYLREHGYVIVARNFRSPRSKGEIDLVGWDGDALCFIEVKTRSTRDIKPAEAAVDQKKKSELREVARHFLHKLAAARKADAPTVRGDVVSVYCDSEGAHPEITLFKNAFGLF